MIRAGTSTLPATVSGEGAGDDAVHIVGGGTAGDKTLPFHCAYYLPKQVQDAAGDEGFLGCVPMKTISANASFSLSASGFVSPTCFR